MVSAPDNTTATRRSPADAEGAGTGPLTLICLGWLPWGRAWKRNQSMTFELSRRPLFDRTLFVNPEPVWIRHLLREGNSSSRRVQRWQDALPHTAGGTTRVRSHWHWVPFKSRIAAGQRFEDWAFRRMVRSFMDRGPFVLLNNNPQFFRPDLMAELMDEARLSVFDLSDDFVEYSTDDAHRERFKERVEHFCTHSDLVLAVNEHLAGKYGTFNANTVVVPNSTNFSNFHRSSYQPVRWVEAIRARGPVLLGCTGILNRHRIDYELVESLAVARPEWQLVFVGIADPCFLEVVDRRDNIHFHPAVPYQELPDWIHAFDAAIIPFRVNEHTRGNDLLKFHDYLALGKSVVTTRTGGASRFEDLVHIADESRGFLECVEDALVPVPDDLRRKRVDTARKNSWNRRAIEIEEILRRHLEGGPGC